MVGGKEGIVREFGMVMYTLLYLKWITNKDLPYSTGNSAPRYVAAWIGGEFGGRMYMTDSLPCSSEIITTLLIAYTPIQNKKFKKKKRKSRGDLKYTKSCV